MTEQFSEQPTDVRSQIEVPLAPAQAFELFTTGIDRWWPREYVLLPGDLEECGVDPEVGGGLWQRNGAGEVSVWGEVLTWDDPSAFAFTWRIGPDWALPADDAPASRVRVSFTPSEAGTLVQLVHDQLEVHGDRWRELRDAVDGPMGWSGLLGAYAGAA